MLTSYLDHNTGFLSWILLINFIVLHPAVELNNSVILYSDSLIVDCDDLAFYTSCHIESRDLVSMTEFKGYPIQTVISNRGPQFITYNRYQMSRAKVLVQRVPSYDRNYGHAITTNEQVVDNSCHVRRRGSFHGV